MTSLSTDTVNHVAKLAKIPLTKSEEKLFAKQLASILDLVDQLKKIDTNGVEPTYQVTGQENCWREDEIDVVSMLKLEKKIFKLPKIIDQNG